MTDDLPDGDMTKAYLKRALKAFKKRLKAYRLDDESRIGGVLSSGRDSGINAIRPPSEFPKEVWDKLVEMGRLREDNGLYELVQQ